MTGAATTGFPSAHFCVPECPVTRSVTVRMWLVLLVLDATAAGEVDLSDFVGDRGIPGDQQGQVVRQW